MQLNKPACMLEEENTRSRWDPETCWEHKPQLWVELESYLDFVSGSVTCIINMLSTMSVFIIPALSHHILSTYQSMSLFLCQYLFLCICAICHYSWRRSTDRNVL